MEPTAWIFAALVVGIVLLFFAIAFVSYVITGAVTLFGWALNQGFVGVAAYFAAWVFMLPLMVVASCICGFFVSREMNAERTSAELNRLRRNTPYSTKAVRAPPPADSEERVKWANRLPPYDD